VEQTIAFPESVTQVDDSVVGRIANLLAMCAGAQK
jgi:hypothetical protein